MANCSYFTLVVGVISTQLRLVGSRPTLQGPTDPIFPTDPKPPAAEATAGRSDHFPQLPEVRWESWFLGTPAKSHAA